MATLASPAPEKRKRGCPKGFTKGSKKSNTLNAPNAKPAEPAELEEPPPKHPCRIATLKAPESKSKKSKSKTKFKSQSQSPPRPQGWRPPSETRKDVDNKPRKHPPIPKGRKTNKWTLYTNEFQVYQTPIVLPPLPSR